MNKNGRPPSDNPLVYPLRVRLPAALAERLAHVMVLTRWDQSHLTRRALEIGLEVLVAKKKAFDHAKVKRQS